MTAEPSVQNQVGVGAHARALHQRALVWDAHMDSLLRVVTDGVDLGVRSDAQADLPRWREGGVDAQVFAVWVDTVYAPYHAARRALQQMSPAKEQCCVRRGRQEETRDKEIPI